MKLSKGTIIIFAIFTAVVWITAIFFNSLYAETFYQILQTKSCTSSHSQTSHKNLWRPPLHSKPDDRIVAQLKWVKEFAHFKYLEKLRPKEILLFDMADSYWGTDCEIKCPGFEFNKCHLTKSTELDDPWEHVGNYDAIVYTQNMGNYMKGEPVVPPTTKTILYVLESPYLVRANLSLNNVILSSYYRGSDIQIPYNKWVPYYEEDGTLREDMLSTASVKNLNELNIASKKTHFATIFMSNCDERYVHNNRMKYLNELKKFIPVDVFGKCGIPSCGKGKAECAQLIRKYKFYLSFENANCRDYITEKFFSNALKNDVIPVVLGAHPDDYKAAAPPHSYIPVEDFDSPEMLANYLKILDKNDTLYNEYFKWKSEGYFYSALSDYFCRVCGMLFYDHFVPQPVWEKNSTWKSVNTCLPRGEWYWKNQI